MGYYYTVGGVLLPLKLKGDREGKESVGNAVTGNSIEIIILS